MEKFTKQNGITLIALIITIIVMLILVAVTISVALNGGLFNNAKEAKTGTQRQAEKEELISVMVGAYNSKGDFDIDLVETLPNGAKWCNEDTEVWSKDLNVNPTGNGDWIITKNNNNFYIDKNGSVLDKKPVLVKYSFTLNDLEPSGFGDGTVKFDDKDAFWNVIGEDLSENEDYFAFVDMDNETNKMYLITSNSPEFYSVADTAGSSGYTVMFIEANDMIGIVFIPITSELVISSYETYESFLETTDSNNVAFGDIEFTFVDISDIKDDE